MRNQQTHKQTIRASGYAPVTREMVAAALERMAAELRQPFQPDPDFSDYPTIPTMTFNQRFEINGNCWLGETPEQGVIYLVIRDDPKRK